MCEHTHCEVINTKTVRRHDCVFREPHITRQMIAKQYANVYIRHSGIGTNREGREPETQTKLAYKDDERIVVSGCNTPIILTDPFGIGRRHVHDAVVLDRHSL